MIPPKMPSSGRPYFTTPPPPNPVAIEAKREQVLQCAKEFGIPECLVHRTCTNEDVGFEKRPNKGSETYNRGKCHEFCVALKRNPSNVGAERIKKKMEELGCNKYRAGQKPDNQMMYIIGGIVVAGIVYFMFIKK